MKYFFSILTCMLCMACSSCFNGGAYEEDDRIVIDSDVVVEDSPITWTECGHQLGDHPCDFSLTDQNGDTFNLYDNYGTLMLIDFSTMWCYYCQVAAQTAQSMQDTYSGQDFLYVTILIEDTSGDKVDASDIQVWVDNYGITTALVLAGSRDFVDLTAESGYPITGWPTFVLINRDMVLEYGMNGWSEEAILSWVENTIDK